MCTKLLSKISFYMLVAFCLYNKNNTIWLVSSEFKYVNKMHNVCICLNKAAFLSNLNDIWKPVTSKIDASVETDLIFPSIKIRHIDFSLPPLNASSIYLKYTHNIWRIKKQVRCFTTDIIGNERNLSKSRLLGYAST